LSSFFSFVPGFVPGTQATERLLKRMDGRVKPGHERMIDPSVRLGTLDQAAKAGLTA
jgi:hypothetical protein